MDEFSFNTSVAAIMELRNAILAAQREGAECRQRLRGRGHGQHGPNGKRLVRARRRQKLQKISRVSEIILRMRASSIRPWSRTAPSSEEVRSRRSVGSSAAERISSLPPSPS